MKQIFLVFLLTVLSFAIQNLKSYEIKMNDDNHVTVTCVAGDASTSQIDKKIITVTCK